MALSHVQKYYSKRSFARSEPTHGYTTRINQPTGPAFTPFVGLCEASAVGLRQQKWPLGFKADVPTPYKLRTVGN